MSGRRDKPTEFEHICYVMMAKIAEDLDSKNRELITVNAHLNTLRERKAEIETILAFSPDLWGF